MPQYDTLAEWLIQECEKRNMSWAEASRGAGISHNAISEIVNGTPAGPKRLLALAEFFDTPIETVYQMAGLLPENDESNPAPSTLARERKLNRIMADIDRMDPSGVARQQLDGALIVQAEMVAAAMRAALKKEEGGE